MRKISVLHDNTERCVALASIITMQELSGQSWPLASVLKSRRHVRHQLVPSYGLRTCTSSLYKSTATATKYY